MWCMRSGLGRTTSLVSLGKSEKKIDYTELKFQRNLAKFAKKNIDYTELKFQRNLAKFTNGREGTGKRRD